jgi:hypothetical protein
MQFQYCLEVKQIIDYSNQFYFILLITTFNNRSTPNLLSPLLHRFFQFFAMKLILPNYFNQIAF